MHLKITLKNLIIDGNMFITDAFIENGKKNTENYNFFGLK